MRLKYLSRAFWSVAAATLLASVYTVTFHPDYGGPFAPRIDSHAKMIAMGERLYVEKRCDTCHGADGLEPVSENTPIVAGQKAPYLHAQLRDIMDGYRTNGMSTQMKAAVGTLSEAEISALSVYLSSIRTK